MLDTRRLRLLVELDRLGTIAAVADALQQTASGISMQLSVLEREVGLTVTERHGRRLRLTPAGRLLAQHGRAIIERLSLAELEIESLRRGAAGTYVITAFPSAARTFVSDVWRQLLHEGSGLELLVSTDEPEQALDALATGQADIAVVHSYSNVPRNFAADITVAHLADDPVWLACRIDDPLAATGTPVALEELADRDWITAPADLTCRTMVSRACGLAGFEPRTVAHSVDFAAQLEFVAAGAGLALIPDLTIAHVPEKVAILPLRSPVRRSIHAAMRSQRRNDPGIISLVQKLTDAAAESAASHSPKSAT
jgi:DNA-binding transcriptional LysR family regulator